MEQIHSEQETNAEAASAKTNAGNPPEINVEPTQGGRQQDVPQVGMSEAETLPAHQPHGAPLCEVPVSSLYDRIDSPIEAVERFGEMIVRSGMFGATKLEHGQILAIAMLAERKSPIELMKKYHLIQGKLTVRSDWMLAEFSRLGGKVEWLEFTNKIATANFTYKGTTTKVSYSMEDAVRAKIQNGPTWARFGDSMLRARCVSKALRMVCAEAVAGTYIPDEISPTPISPADEAQLFTPQP